jgi:hypothetical protein
MEFERHLDPQKSLHIGKYSPIDQGRKFMIRFDLRKSQPDFYPLQKQKYIEALALENETSYEHIYFKGTLLRSVKILIPTIYGPQEFYAHWDLEDDIWMVGDK